MKYAIMAFHVTVRLTKRISVLGTGFGVSTCWIICFRRSVECGGRTLWP